LVLEWLATGVKDVLTCLQVDIYKGEKDIYSPAAQPTNCPLGFKATIYFLLIHVV
jgi:hypothetical protein